MVEPIQITQRLTIGVRDGDGAPQTLGVLRLENGHHLAVDQANERGTAVLQRLCDKYNAMDRLLCDTPPPDGEVGGSWSQIIGRKDSGFAEALIAAIEQDFGLEISRA